MFSLYVKDRDMSWGKKDHDGNNYTKKFPLHWRDCQ